MVVGPWSEAVLFSAHGGIRPYLCNRLYLAISIYTSRWLPVSGTDRHSRQTEFMVERMTNVWLIQERNSLKVTYRRVQDAETFAHRYRHIFSTYLLLKPRLSNVRRGRHERSNHLRQPPRQIGTSYKIYHNQDDTVTVFDSTWHEAKTSCQET